LEAKNAVRVLAKCKIFAAGTKKGGKNKSCKGRSKEKELHSLNP